MSVPYKKKHRSNRSSPPGAPRDEDDRSVPISRAVVIGAAAIAAAAAAAFAASRPRLASVRASPGDTLPAVSAVPFASAR